MKRTCFLSLLVGGSLLLASPGLSTEKQPAAENSRTEETISAEDLQVIAHMEILQQMEMLKDFQILSAGEEKQ